MGYGDPQLLHVDKVLTQISVDYTNNGLVGDQLFPTVGVDKQSDRYLVQNKDGFTVLDDIRGPGANTNEMPPMTLSRDSYFAEEHALKDWVAVEESDNADPGIDAMGRAAARVTNTILLNREDAIQTFARTTANYAAGHSTTLSGTTQWNDYTTPSQPISDLKVARDAIFADIFQTPNIAILGYDVATKLEDHPAYLNRMKTTPLASNNGLDAVGELAGIPRLIRAGAVKQTNNLGQTPTFGYMWGKDVVVAYVPDNPGRGVPAFGYEFNWAYQGATMPTDRWFDTDRKSWAVRTTRRYDIKVVAVDTVASGKATGGYVIKAAVL